MTSSQHPYGKQGRHRAPVTPRPHLRRLVATVGLCVVAALAIVGATVGAHPAVPTVQAAVPVQAVPVGPGQPHLLPRSGTVAVQEMGMRVAETTAPATTTTTEPTTSAASTSTPTTTAPTTSPTTASTPTATADGTPDPTTTSTVTETPMPTTTSVATCKAVTT